MFQFVRTLALLLCLILPMLSAAARQRSYLTKVFRLTDAQTRRLYEKGTAPAPPEFFAQPVDSFPTDQPGRAGLLPLDYYLRAHTEGSQLVYQLLAVTDRHLTLLYNQADLTVLVRDSAGRLLPDARVLLPSGRPVPYHAQL